MAPSLLVIVLHYRGIDDTMECLASLANHGYENCNVLVVDNGTIDKLKDKVTPVYPWAELLEIPENRGWSGGNNAGLRLAIERRYDVVCLLNNDTVVPEGTLSRLMETIAVLGPCCLHPAIDSYGADERIQLDPSIPEPPEMIVRPVSGMNGIFEINMINGCCLLMNMPIFEKIGLIDERFFLLFEDADLGRRTLAAGYPMYCDTSARIKYKESRGFGGRRTPIKTYYSVRNFFLFTEKHNSLRARVSLARYVGWTIWRTAEAAGSPPKSWNDVFRWLLSADIYAKATRMGLRDYLLRRFGRVSKRDESTLRAHREIREPG